jgi:hypothetical protein
MADGEGLELSPNARRLIASLERAYRATPSPHLDAAMMTALQAGASTGERLTAARPRRGSVLTRRRFVSLGAALALAMSGVAGFLRLSGPMPVSAQAVLRRAAAAQVTSDAAAHLIYAVTATDGYTGTGEVWVQANLGGTPHMVAQTLTMGKDGVTVAALSSRTVQTGPQVYTYTPRDNTITLNPDISAITLVNGVPGQAFDGPWVAQRLSQVAQSRQPGVQLLPQQAMNGATVDVVTFTRGTTRATFYFDAQSYLLRGFDVIDEAGRAWQARLSAEDAVAVAAVPAGTFLLNAPATARVVPPHPVPGSAATILMDGPTSSAFAAACGRPATDEEIFRLKHALADGKSLLAACQRTAASMTAAGLVAALVAPNKVALDDAVAAGQITPAQGAASLAALRAHLTIWVTAPWPHR